MLKCLLDFIQAMQSQNVFDVFALFQNLKLSTEIQRKLMELTGKFTLNISIQEDTNTSIHYLMVFS